MPPRHRGRPLKGIQRTIPTRDTSQQCCTHLPTVKCIIPNPCECRAANQTCTGICPSTNCFNKGGQPPPPWGMQLAGTIPMRTTKVKRHPLRNSPRPPAEQPTYCQVILPITFQDNNPTFSPIASSVGGAGPSTPSSASAVQATPELPKTATVTPDSATPTVLEVNHFSLNLTLTTGY